MLVGVGVGVPVGGTGVAVAVDGTDVAVGVDVEVGVGVPVGGTGVGVFTGVAVRVGVGEVDTFIKAVLVSVFEPPGPATVKLTV